MPTSEKQSSSINATKNYSKLHNKNHALKLNENKFSTQPSSIQIYDQLMERSNVELNIYITNELCENPIAMTYNPNKSNAISRRDDNSEIKVNRLRNNVASRISRLKRKRGFQLSTIKCEYLEMANDALEQEINEMALKIRKKENLLAEKFNSDNLIDQLRNDCGLENDVTIR